MKVVGRGLVCTALVHLSIALSADLISNFTVNVVKTQHTVVFGCNEADLLNAGRALNQWNQVILLLNLKRNFSLADALSPRSRVKTTVVIDCACPECKSVLKTSSNMKSFNKTYQWMIWDSNNWGLTELLGDVTYIGPNTQMTYVNTTGANYSLYDVHSKGGHLNAPLEVVHYGNWDGKLTTYANIFKLQGIQSRAQFNQLTLRGGIVIDRDNITTNEQILSIMANSKYIKEDGLTPFIKYHYDLLSFLQERFNFTLNYRNPRGWAGRLGGRTFRLGYLGIVSRNEIDIGASSALNRINRLAEYDTIHQSWKFESAFVYRFIIDLDTNGGSGNFLAPFTMQVWAFFCLTIVLVIVIWRLIAWLMSKGTEDEKEVDDGFLLQTLAAICQQGLDPIPKTLPSRTIVFTLLVFSLMMYNFYTSSVVGGLLSSSDQGPKTVADIVNSPLKLAFEDIGYYKVLFMQLRTPLVRQMYIKKVLPKRRKDELQVFIHTKDSVPYLKKGGYAFHCELVDIFPEIARSFDANEVCDLRIVSGLLETEVMNWIVPKNSMYTELFRTMMCRAREVGVVTHTLALHRPEKPRCESAYTVYPVTWSSVVTPFELLGVGMLAAGMALIGEIILHRNSKRVEK